MQITTFNPMILSKNADEIIKLEKTMRLSQLTQSPA